MSGFSVKAYLETDSGVEVRRFAICKGDAKNFDKICEKLWIIYGQSLSSEDGFAIYWKDEEGDEIRASSDDELAFAIKCCKDDTLKIYLRKLKANPSESSPRKHGEGEHHPGVVCDSCNNQINGFRYKCMQCPDFDLCGDCEQKGHHGEHNMMRIPSPLKPGLHHKWNFRPRRHHHWRRHQQGAGTGTESEGKKSPTDGRPPRFGEPFHPYSLLSKMWSAFGGMPYDLMNPQNRATTSATQTADPSTSNAATDGDKTHENDTEMKGPFSTEDYLRNVGETVAAVLDPFGIDVLVDVEHNGVRECINRQNFTAQTSTQPPPPTQTQPQDPAQAPASAPAPTQEKVSLDAETGVSHQGLDGATDPKIAASTSDFSIQNSEVDHADWTCLDFTENAIIENADPMDLMPKLLANVSISDPQHPDPHIAAAAAQMMSMGFDNTHGWLTAVLALNGGNIDRVCDILTSLGQPNGPTQQFIETFIALLDRNGGDTAKVIAIMQSMKKP